jgi:protoheme IX farnesyltransferase
MPTVTDESGRMAARWSFVNTLLLVAVSLMPVILHQDSAAYAVVAGIAGAWFLWRAVVFLRVSGRDTAARKLFLASIAYLPVTLGALVVDRMFFH